MPDSNENQESTPGDQSAVVEKDSSFPLESKELTLNAASVDVTWSKAEEAALVRRLGMFDPGCNVQGALGACLTAL
jgi:hypothetical protein